MVSISGSLVRIKIAVGSQDSFAGSSISGVRSGSSVPTSSPASSRSPLSPPLSESIFEKFGDPEFSISCLALLALAFDDINMDLAAICILITAMRSGFVILCHRVRTWP